MTEEYTETLVWKPTGKEKPVNLEGVYLFVRKPNGDEAWAGYRDSEKYRWHDGSEVKGEVLAWAPLPGGPTA